MMSALADTVTAPLTGFLAFLLGGAVVSGVGLYVVWQGERAKHRLAYFHLASVLGIWSVVSGTALTAPAAGVAQFWATVSCVLTLLVIAMAYRFAAHALDVERERRPVLKILVSVAAVAAFFAITGRLDLVKLVPEAGGVGAAVGQALDAGADLVPRLRWQAALVVGGVLAGLGGALHLTWQEWQSDNAGIRGREAAWIAVGLVATGGVLLQFVPGAGGAEFPVGTLLGAIGLVVLARAARGEVPPPTGVTAVTEGVLDAAWGPMLVCDRDGRIRGVGETFTREYGHDEESLVRQKLQRVLAQPGSDALTVRRMLVAGSTGGELPVVHLRTDHDEVVLARIEAARLGHVGGESAGLAVLFQEASGKRTARSLDRFDRLYRDPRSGSAVPVAITTLDEGRMLEANDELLELTGHLREEFLGRTVDDLGISVEGGWNALARPAPRGQWSDAIRTTYRTRSQHTREATVHASRIRLGSEECLLMLIHRVGTRKSRGSSSRSPLLYDQLTGLPNGSLFENRLEHALARARARDERLSVLVVRMKGLGHVIDTRGRAAADQTIRVVAHRLNSSFRELDTVSYLGEQEFAVLLEELDDGEAAVSAAARFLESLADPLEVWGWTVELSARIGIAMGPDGEAAGDGTDDVQGLIERARRAQRQAMRPDADHIVRASNVTGSPPDAPASTPSEGCAETDGPSPNAANGPGATGAADESRAADAPAPPAGDRSSPAGADPETSVEDPLTTSANT